ncbi:hypothetical protein B0H15DRAFT_989325 [Mycena belliarum]|uniref:Uncharacterized protein n=1 Tax=Mycena belliarum TaxID=1033014 RepID=A0AAD6XPW9_9AGAR|nr:hypothetical protein B0H15DRAFT_989325 [Mycena belliae]
MSTALVPAAMPAPAEPIPLAAARTSIPAGSRVSRSVRLRRAPRSSSSAASPHPVCKPHRTPPIHLQCPRALPPASSLHPPPALVALPGRRHAMLAMLPPRHRHRRRPEPGPIPVVYEHDGRRRPAVWERALPAALTLPVPHAHVNEQPGMGYVPVLPCAGNDAEQGREIDGMRATSPSRILEKGRGNGSWDTSRRHQRRLPLLPPQWHMHTVSPSRLNAAAAPATASSGARSGQRGTASNGVRAPCCLPLLPRCIPLCAPTLAPPPSERLLAATASNAIAGPRRRRFERTHRANASSALATRPVPHAQCPPRIRG